MSRWVDRNLFESPIYIALCTQPPQFEAELTRLRVPHRSWPPFLASQYADATTHFFEKFDGKECAIVTIRAGGEREGIAIAGLLVHEAVHIWQRICRRIGEHNPSDEFEAWSLQRLSQTLMLEYQRQTEGTK